MDKYTMPTDLQSEFLFGNMRIIPKRTCCVSKRTHLSLPDSYLCSSVTITNTPRASAQGECNCSSRKSSHKSQLLTEQANTTDVTWPLLKAYLNQKLCLGYFLASSYINSSPGINLPCCTREPCGILGRTQYVDLALWMQKPSTDPSTFEL